MTKIDVLGAFEQLVLLALVRLGERAYGMTVRREIEQRTSREISLGAVYATLDRLEEKGLVRSQTGSGGAERGGRARRFFKVQGSGLRALGQTLGALDRMRAGVDVLPAMGGARA